MNKPPHPLKGRKLTPETKEKMRAAWRRRLIREGRMQGQLSKMKPNCLADFDEDF